MKKLTAMVMVVLVVALGLNIVASAYSYDPTVVNYTNNNYGYNQYNYNCTGMRTSYSNYEYQPSSWFDIYKQQYGVVFHIAPTMPISRNDVFAPVGKAMDRAYSRSGRRFSNSYGVNFVDYTWNSSLNQIAGGLYQRGIMVGYPEDNTVRFPQNITRAELAKVLVLTAKENGIYNGYTKINATFQDTIGHWAESYIAECNALGLMVGKSSYIFAPQDYVTYEEYVTVMLRMAERANGNTGYNYNNYYSYSNYSMSVEDVEYGISTTMDIDFNGYNSTIEDISAYNTSKSITMKVGKTYTLKVKVSPSDIDLLDNDIVWKSSKTSIVRVNNVSNNGRYAECQIESLKEGKATVTAKVANNSYISVDFDITVTDDDYDYDYDDTVYVSSIRLNPTSVELGIGESQSITATVSPANATNKGLLWESHNTSVATVNQSGRITAVGVGNTTVTATAKDGSGVVATIDVTVTTSTVVVVSDTVAPIVEITGADNVSVGKFVTLTVKATDENLASFDIIEADLLGLTGGASINKITKVSNDTYEIRLMGVEVSSLALCIKANVAVDTAGNRSAESNEVVIFINSGEM